MPICKKCNDLFPNRVKINNKIRNLCNRKYCLNCSPFGKHNTKILDGRKRKPNKNNKTNKNIKCICIQCNRKYIYDHKKGHNKNECNSCCVTKSKRKTKLKAIEYMGGKCKICKYNKCIASLCFHHKDPSKKDFAISNKGRTIGWEKLKKEIDKCILLCLNCHGELHYKQNSKNFNINL